MSRKNYELITILIPGIYYYYNYYAASKRTFEKSSAMTPKSRNRRIRVINQIDAVSELLLEITLKGNSL